MTSGLPWVGTGTHCGETTERNSKRPTSLHLSTPTSDDFQTLVTKDRTVQVRRSTHGQRSRPALESACIAIAESWRVLQVNIELGGPEPCSTAFLFPVKTSQMAVHFKFGAEGAGGTSEVFWIATNASKREIFIHFKDTGMGRIPVPVYHDGKVVSRETGMDHLSFHSDGTVHATHKSSGGKTHRSSIAQLRGNIYSQPPEAVIALLALSWNARRSVGNTKTTTPGEFDAIVHLGDTQAFTICLFLASVGMAQAKAMQLTQRFGLVDGATPSIICLEEGEPTSGSQPCLIMLPTPRLPPEFANGYLKSQLDALDSSSSREWTQTIAVFPSIAYLAALA